VDRVVPSPTVTAPKSSGRGEILLLTIVLLAEAVVLVLGLGRGDPLLAVWLALGAVYLLLAIRATETAWLMALAAVPFSMERQFSGGSISIPTEPMLLLALVGWVIRALFTGGVRLRSSPLHMPLAFLAGFTLLSVLLGSHITLGLKAWLAMAGYVAFGYLYFSSTACVSGRRERWVKLASVLGAAAGLYGAARVLLLGIGARTAYGAARPFFAEHGTYAAFLAMLLPIPLFEALERRGSARLAYATAAFAILMGLVLSFTRAAWISVVVVLPISLFLWVRIRGAARTLSVGMVVVLAAVLVVLATGAGDRLLRHVTTITQIENVSNLERVNRWMAAWEMFRDRPVTGIGYDAFGVAYPGYRRKTIVTDQVYQRMGTHSEPLRLLAETGIGGFAAGLWLITAASVVGIKTFRREPHGASGRLALASLTGIWTYVIHSFFNAYLGLDKVTVPFWLLLGAVAALSSLRDPERRPEAPS
jgi:putative inorganic carbon (HCO3(-)) transporter